MLCLNGPVAVRQREKSDLDPTACRRSEQLVTPAEQNTGPEVFYLSKWKQVRESTEDMLNVNKALCGKRRLQPSSPGMGRKNGSENAV
jgi:hypothetical protein